MSRWNPFRASSKSRVNRSSIGIRPAPRRLAFEQLEDRTVLAVSWFYIGMMGDVTINIPPTETGTVNIAAIDVGGVPYLAVDGDHVGNASKTIKASNVQHIEITGTQTSRLKLNTITNANGFTHMAMTSQYAIEVGFTGSHANIIEGSEFADDINGGQGDDVIVGNRGDDRLDGGAGSDRVFGDGAAQAGDVWDDVHDVNDGDDDLFGGTDRDFLYGSGGEDWMYGGLGNDELFGGDHRDLMWGEDGHDYMEGQQGDDWMHGGAGSDILKGDDGADHMWGGPDASGLDTDVLYGGANADYIHIADNWGNDYALDAEEEDDVYWDFGDYV